MAREERLRYFIEAIWKGGNATVQASRDIKDVGKSAETSAERAQGFGDSLSDLWAVAAGGAAVFGSVKKAIDLAFEGAQIATIEDRFNKLAASVGATGDALLESLQGATQGLSSNAELMAGASDLINYGLANSAQEATRLSRIVTGLGADMQTLALIMNNMSFARLDSIGLSAIDVKERMKDLEAQGYATEEAFRLAVLASAEDKLKTFGDQATTTEGQLKALNVEVMNYVDGFKTAFATGFAANASEILGGYADSWGITTTELGKFVGYLLSPEPQRAFEFLATLGLGVEGADQNMLQLARSFYPVAEGVEEVTEGMFRLRKIINIPVSEWGVLDAAKEMPVLSSAVDAITASIERMQSSIQAGRQERGGLFAGLFDPGEMNAANATLLQTAANAGAAGTQILTLAENSEAARAALTDSAFQQKARELGEAVAEGALSGKTALEELQSFMEGFDLDAYLFGQGREGVTTHAEFIKDQSMAVVEGIDTAATTAASGAKTALDELKTTSEELTESPWPYEMQSDSIQTAVNRIREFKTEIASLEGISVSASVSVSMPAEAKALGGPVFQNMPYMVGEQGPELFVPNTSGTIVPNNKTGRMGASGQTIINAPTTNQFMNGLGPAAVMAQANRSISRYGRGAR